MVSVLVDADVMVVLAVVADIVVVGMFCGFDVFCYGWCGF